jgi:trigger factor
MPQVVRENIDDLHITLSLTFTKEDYKDKVEKKLNKIKNTASIKGFRPGKVPASRVRSMYAQSTLGEVIEHEIQHTLDHYIKENNLQYFGQPLTSEAQEKQYLAYESDADYTFKFDLGLMPTFTLNRLDKDDVFTAYKISVSEEEVDKEMDNMQRKTAARTKIEEGAIIEDDLLKIDVVELENGEAKEGGIHHNFSILVKGLEDDIKAKVLTLSVNDTFQFDIFNLEKGSDTKLVKKYFLGISEEDDRAISDTFEATIQEITRIDLPELNEEFLTKQFGEEVKTIEDARAVIRQQIESYLGVQANNLIDNQIRVKLMEKNPLEFPTRFLRRWLLETNEKMTEEKVDADLEVFVKDLQWTIVRDRIAKEENVEIEFEDIRYEVESNLRNYFGFQLPDEYIATTVNKMLEDEKTINETYYKLMNEEIFNILRKNVHTEEKKVELEAFYEIAKNFKR